MKKHQSLIWSDKTPTESMREEIDTLPSLTARELRETFGEVFGYATASNNKQYLIRKIIWGIQAREWGDISDETRKKAHELADFRQLRIRMNKFEKTAASDEHSTTIKKSKSLNRDPRLPIPGSVITKDYDGQRIEVRVLDDAFEYGGQTFRSLSAIARKLTGANRNGFAFFGLGGVQ